jgi:hypothetical protein
MSIPPYFKPRLSDLVGVLLPDTAAAYGQLVLAIGGSDSVASNAQAVPGNSLRNSHNKKKQQLMHLRPKSDGFAGLRTYLGEGRPLLLLFDEPFSNHKLGGGHNPGERDRTTR